MNVLLFGATGMIGQGVLRECLLDPGVDRVLAVGRSSTGQRDEKLRNLVLPDVADLAGAARARGLRRLLLLPRRLCGRDVRGAVHAVDYGLTFTIAQTLARLNPGMTFVYVSGAGTDSSEGGRTMWARVKGRTENALLRFPFKVAYMFRPAAIVPMHGVRSKTRWYRVLYALTTPFYPVLRALLPNGITTTERVGRAMLAVARRGYPKPFSRTDINCLTPAGRTQPVGALLVMKRLSSCDHARSGRPHDSRWQKSRSAGKIFLRSLMWFSISPRSREHVSPLARLDRVNGIPGREPEG